MINTGSLSAEWITKSRKKLRKDPSIIEGMIYALYLLERLKHSGLDFIFKGGTSLILLLEQPKRFSVDIDIIVSPSIKKPDLEKYLSKIVESGNFTRMELDEKRSYQGAIPKAHYKFYYVSNFAKKDREGIIISDPLREILLDIVFAHNPYPVLVDRPVQTEWLLQDGEPLTVTIPNIDSITGDKLTAFAPNTTGVAYGVEKEKEIMKQLYDIGCLFDFVTDIEVVKRSFRECLKSEIEFRPERKIESSEKVLKDIIETSLLISRIVSLSPAEKIQVLKEIYTGINQFRHYVFEGTFSLMDAKLASSKAALLAAIILTDFKGMIPKFKAEMSISEFLITSPEYNSLNKRLKFVSRGEALYYWSQTIKLLS